MQVVPRLVWLRCLKSIIDFSPLMIEPDRQVSAAVALMAKGGKSVLVGSGSQVLGWLTEKDVVKLVASDVDLRTTPIDQVMHTSTILLKLSECVDIPTVISLVQQYESGLVAIIDDQRQVVGTITAESVFAAVQLELATTNGDVCSLDDRDLLVQPELREIEGLTEIAEHITQDITNHQLNGESLPESEQHFRIMADTAPVLLWLSGTNGICNFCNKIWVDFTGITLAQELNNGWLEAVHPEDAQSCLALYLSAFETRQSFFMEYRLRRFDGEYRWLLDKAVPRYTADGTFIGYIGCGIDITELKQTQAALEQVNAELEQGVAKPTEALPQINRQLVNEIRMHQQLEAELEKSEERFRFLAECIPQQVWITEADGTLEYINQRTCDYFGLRLEQILGWKWQEWIHPDDLPRCLDLWQKSLATGESLEMECRYLSGTDNTYRWHLVRALPWRDQQGNIVNWFGTNTDIDQRVSAELALQETELRYHTIATLSMVGIFHTDAMGNCLYVNDRWCLIAGMSRAEASGVGWLGAIHPEDREWINQRWYAAAIQKIPFQAEYRFQRRDGSISWVFGQAVAERGNTGEIIAYVGTITDISDRKLAESALDERVRLADFRADVDSILTQNQNLRQMMGCCTEAIVKHLGAAFARIWILNKEENVLELQVSSGMYTHTNGFHSRIPVGQYKIGLIAQEGKPHLTNSVLNDPRVSNKEWAKQEGMTAFAGYPLIVEGETLGVIAIFSRQAITESTFQALQITANEIAIGIKRKLTEEALKNSEQRFRNLVEASTDWVWEVDENGVYTYASPQVQDILGYTPAEIVGKTPFELMPLQEAQRMASIFGPIAAAQVPLKCLENINIHRDGHIVVLETSGVPIFDGAGKFCGYRGIDRDITVRRRSQAVLRQTQEQLQAILDNSPAVIYVLDSQDRYLVINRQYEQLFHVSQKQIIGKSIYEIWPYEIAQSFAVDHHKVITDGISLETEEEIPQQDGIHTYISVKFPLRDSNGVPYAVCGISTDITDRKRAEEELRHSEERLALLVEGVKDYAIYMLDPQGLVMSWNSGAECITGYQSGEIIGENFSRLFPAEDIANNLPNQHIEIAKSLGRYEYEGVFLRQDGSKFWANCSLTALHDASGHLRGFSKVTRDITERKLVEESLLRLRKAIESTSDAISIFDVTGQVIYINPAFTEIFNYTHEELNASGGVAANFQTQEVFARIFEIVQRGASWRGEVTMRSRHGSIIQIDLRADAIKDVTGKILATVCIYTDITQRQEAEEGLWLRDRAIAASSNGIAIADVTIPNAPIMYVNSAFEQMNGYTAAEVMGQNYGFLLHGDLNQPQLQKLNAAMQTGQDCTVILRNYRKDGKLSWHQLNISPVYDVDSQLTHYIGIQTDITERKQLEQELTVALEKEKELNQLKSRFISMISHEFRTPLSTILSSSELLEHYRHKWTEEKQNTHLHRIQTAVKHMTEMLNDVLFIAKSAAGILNYRPKSLDLVEYCRDLVAEVELELKNQQSISFISQLPSIPCNMDEKLIGHILHNLLSNAIKYSPANTTIEFTLSCQQSRAVFEIKDEGIGIPAKDLPHLFTSFHRAENVGNIPGTGLGLAIVKNCVDMHEGEIEVASTLEVGSTFTVSLPLNPPQE